MKKILCRTISIMLIVAIVLSTFVFSNAAVTPMTPVVQTDVNEYYNMGNSIYTKRQVVGPDNNGQYDVTLEAYTSDVIFLSQSQATPVDILILLDNSASMQEGSGDNERLKKAKNAITQTLDKLVNAFKVGTRLTINIAFYTFTNFTYKEFDYRHLTSDSVEGMKNKVNGILGNVIAGTIS